MIRAIQVGNDSRKNRIIWDIMKTAKRYCYDENLHRRFWRKVNVELFGDKIYCLSNASVQV